jgi:hypothetical protein
VDDEVVTAHRVLQASREPLELLFDPLVLEGCDPSAAIADGVMVVFAARHDGLEARAAVPELDPLDEAHVVQEVQGAVDARDAGVAAAAAQALVDLLSREAAVLTSELPNDRVACAAGAMPGLGQRCPGGPFPVGY